MASPGLLQAAAAEFAKLKKPTTMSEDMDAEQQQQQQQGEGSEEEEWEDEDEDDMPSYEFRFECAKMLLELDDTTETAIQVGVHHSRLDCCIVCLGQLTAAKLPGSDGAWACSLWLGSSMVGNRSCTLQIVV
jgi:hypothetical protein